MYSHPIGKPEKSQIFNDTKNILNLILLSYWDNIYTEYMNAGKAKNKAIWAQF